MSSSSIRTAWGDWAASSTHSWQLAAMGVKPSESLDFIHSVHSCMRVCAVGSWITWLFHSKPLPPSTNKDEHPSNPLSETCTMQSLGLSPEAKLWHHLSACPCSVARWKIWLRMEFNDQKSPNHVFSRFLKPAETVIQNQHLWQECPKSVENFTVHSKNGYYVWLSVPGKALLQRTLRWRK